MKSRKVFCLGFQKTGTSSLGLALGKLGYRVTGYYPFRDLAAKDDLTWEEIRERAMRVAVDFDAAQDTPWPLLYRELDTAFPGSRFILVVRNEDSWIQSAVKDFGHFPNAIHNLIYECPFPVGNEETWLARYRQHNTEVQEYFADRPGDFLSLHLNSGEVNWDNVCRFLDEPNPGTAWPHANTQAAKSMKMKYYKVLRKLGLKRP